MGDGAKYSYILCVILCLISKLFVKHQGANLKLSLFLTGKWVQAFKGENKILRISFTVCHASLFIHTMDWCGLDWDHCYYCGTLLLITRIMHAYLKGQSHEIFNPFFCSKHLGHIIDD